MCVKVLLTLCSFESLIVCWGRSRGCDLQAGPRQLETPHPSPVLGICILPPIPAWGAISRMQPWESDWDSNVWLTPFEQYMCLNTSRILYKLLRFSQVGAEIYLSYSHPRQACMYVSLLIRTAIYQSGVACCFFPSLLDLHIWRPISDFIWGTPMTMASCWPMSYYFIYLETISPGPFYVWQTFPVLIK